MPDLQSATKLTPDNEAAMIHSSLVRFATLLGTFKTKEDENGSSSSSEKCSPYTEVLASLTSPEEFTATFPSLSLESASGSHACAETNKTMVEALAAQNLGRSITVEHSTASTQVSHEKNATDLQFSASSVTPIPRRLLDNLSASFSLLLDARLRAYASILLRHEVSLAECPSLTEEEQQEKIQAVEHKLATLTETGSQTVVDTIVTYFHEAPTDDPSSASCSNFPITLEAVMDVSIPCVAGEGKECLTVTLSAPGTIKGSLDHTGRLNTLHVDVNMHELLKVMIDRAGQVMSVVVDKVNFACGTHQGNEDSFSKSGASKPEASRKRKHEALDDDTPMSPSIVSPDLGSARGKQTPEPIPLLLNSGNKRVSVSSFTVEACADIVDVVIGDVCEDFFGASPSKKVNVGLTI
mmetsp:Transcript_5141/g.7821  ORF Transcript_5141/g.7821 Transcript_5141/m.7821 type:complete len:410 (+) Transcript_5141:136-1365(+)|eukprot:CAMPEP_0195286168 /NCGR_PEP_ID=MMETSP0707-20130614/3724_1 /TAXON_ID=33640 /ORGANISM="Asterionellopsis glacialis, Strain CCMP134" /LENGTH=409 /DNA_ID=CAMNT_0040345767 /DNA_START=129 /DNA_END=1358 /DNA_ORIENTATION=+